MEWIPRRPRRSGGRRDPQGHSEGRFEKAGPRVCVSTAKGTGRQYMHRFAPGLARPRMIRRRTCCPYYRAEKLLRCYPGITAAAPRWPRRSFHARNGGRIAAWSRARSTRERDTASLRGCGCSMAGWRVWAVATLALVHAGTRYLPPPKQHLPPESIRLNSSKSGIGEYLVPFQQGLDRASLLDGAGGSLRPCHPLLQLPLAVMIDDVPGTRRATILRFASTLAAGQNEVITGRHLLAKHPIDADWAPSNKMVYGWNSWWPHRSRGITPAAVSRSCRYTMLAGYLCCPVCGATRWQSGLRCLKRWKDPCRWAPAAAHSARKSLLRGTCTPRVFAGRGTGSHRVAGSHARRA